MKRFSFERAVKNELKKQLFSRGMVEVTMDDALMTHLARELVSMNEYGWDNQKLVTWFVNRLN